MYKVSYRPQGPGEFIKSIGEEYKVVKRGRKYYGCGEEFNVERRVRGSNIIVPFILRLSGRLSKGVRGEQDRNFGEENQVVKRGRKYYGCGEEYNVEKRERGSNIIFPILLKLSRRISRGEGEENGGEENQDLKK